MRPLLLADIRYALRQLMARPLFTAVAVLSAGLGIGVNGAIFTWMKSIYLDPLPGVERASELITVNARFGPRAGYSNSFADLQAIRDASRDILSGVFAHEMVMANLGAGERPEVVVGGVVSGNYFDVLGVKPALGRGFRPEEDSAPNAHPVVVLSHALWQRRFGGDAGVIGRSALLNRLRFTIVGVAPERFAGVYGGLGQEFWVPLEMNQRFQANGEDGLRNGSSWLQIMGRRRPGADLEAVRANLQVVSAQIRQTHRRNDREYEAEVYPLHKAQRGLQSSLFPVVQVLAGVVALVLLIACLNVANLLLARASQRSREIAIRLSLGASRRRLVRQLLTESLVLATLAGTVGWLVARWTAGALPRLMPPLDGITLALDVRQDWTVMAFLAAATLVSALVFGLLPALQATRPDLVDALKESAGALSAGRKRHRLRQALVVGQVALSMAALVGAGLFGRSLRNAASAEPGFRPQGVLVGKTDLFLAGYDQARGQAFWRAMTETVRALPGVESAGLTSFQPLSLSGGGSTSGLEVEGYQPAPNERLAVVTDVAGPGYLRTLGVPLLRGRDFDDRDTAAAEPVALVNETFARQYFGSTNGVGKRIRVAKQWRQVVGVYRDYKYRRVNEDPRANVLLPLGQDYRPAMILMVRSAGDPAALVGPLRAALGSLDRNVPLEQVATLADRMRDALFDQRLAATLLAAFAALALTLAAAGLYGVMSAYVAQRQKELGIRSALGAAPRDLLRLVIGQGMRLTLVGVAVGLALAAGLGQLVGSMLVGVSGADPLTFASVAGLLAAVAAAACWWPAQIAASADPAQTLRAE